MSADEKLLRYVLRLVGSDAPSIDAGYLKAARHALAEVDCVLGPALDGGYVLFGLRRFVPELFTGISWGEDSVLEKTLEKLAALGWSYRLLETLADIDRPEDLRHLPDSLRAELPGPRRWLSLLSAPVVPGH